MSDDQHRDEHEPLGTSEEIGDGAGDETIDGADAQDEIDGRLANAGDQLRSDTDLLDGRQVVNAALRRQVIRARRRSWITSAAAALVAVAALGAVLVTRGDAGGDADRIAAQRTVRGSSGADTPVEGEMAAAYELVASLPDEPVDPHTVELVASVSRYDSCEALLGELHSVGAAHIGSRGFGETYGMYPGPVPFAPDGVSRNVGSQERATLALTDDGAGSGGETLGTNVIVDGVDEADQVKASGTLVVELSGASLRVIDTTATAVVATLPLVEDTDDRERWAAPSSLIVDGRRAVVFGSESVAADPIPGDPSAARPTRNYLTVTFVDLTDAAAPTITERVRVEGSMVAVRRVGDQVRMVTSSSLADLPIVYPTTPNAVAPALEQNRLAVATSAVGDWIPDWDRGESTDAEPLMGCDDVGVPDTFAGVQMTSMVQFDIDGPFEPQATGLVAPSEDLTATATDVVVASHVWVDPIDRAEDFSDWSTALHRFTFAEDGPRYLASGAVDGSVRDDFSLSVLDDGTVGVVTVDVLPWDARDEADITVRLLATDPDAEVLTERGALVPAGSGVGISGLRFIGDRLLLSSGLSGNAVSVVDLTDRDAPADLGVVHMRGSGEYLHPLEDHRVLVVGTTLRKVGEDLRSGLHASLLDLNGAPAVVAMWELDDASAQVGYDHHAFTWWPRRSIAGFGIMHHSWGPAIAPAPDALFLAVAGDAVTPGIVSPREADLGPRCRIDQLDRSNCDDTGPPSVSRVLVIDGDPWLYTSESLEQLDPESFASIGIVPLRR